MSKKLFLLIFFGLGFVQQQVAQTFYGMSNVGGTDNLGAFVKYNNSNSSLVALKSLQTITPGSSPEYTELREYNGKFYGMTKYGGSNEDGFIFEWDPQTNVYTPKVSLSVSTGSNPISSLTLKDGKFYGVLSGGINYNGVIFEWDPVTNLYTKKYDFIESSGIRPVGDLILKDGKFYGMTQNGGANSYGVIFEWDPATNSYSKKKDLSDSLGSVAQGSLTLKDGIFYGMTRGGGLNGQGVIFEWNPTTNVYTKKIDLANQSSNPYGSLILKDGKFYGMTNAGGSSSVGVIFEWNPTTNVYINKINLSNATGSRPYGNLCLVGGVFYGLTSTGGANNLGVLFEWNPTTNAYTKKIDFSTASGGFPMGTLVSKDGILYGMTNSGGVINRGTIFSWSPTTNILTKKIDFNIKEGQYSSGKLSLKDNKFYGVTPYGGANDNGVIFEWNAITNVYTKKIDFSTSIGTLPRGSLALKDNKFYGSSQYGGANNRGVIFEWDPSTNVFTKKIDLSATIGANPNGDLILMNGKFYGTTSNGGANNRGVIFEWDPITNIYIKKFDFSSALGTGPLGSLTLKDGKFYGMTSSGGSSNVGVIFEWNPTTNVYTKKVDLNSSIGSNPQGNLTLLNNKFYGMTQVGGANNLGVIFEWDPTTNVYTKKVDLNSATGIYPTGSLTLYNSVFYGLTSAGGSNNMGVVFEWNPTTNIYIKKADFTGANGASPSYSDLVYFDPCIVPTVFTTTGGGSYCSGANGVAIGLEGSETDVAYQLKLNGTPVGTPIPGTGSAVSFGLQTIAGDYTVEATRIIGGCTSNMNGLIVVSITTSTSNTSSASACDTYTWPVNNQTYTASGIFSYIVNCHTETLNLTIQNSTTYYQDSDGDGFGNTNVAQNSCNGTPIGYVLDNNDCNDNQILYSDADNDGFGSTAQAACGVTNSTDCDDVNNAINPNATEICNGIDDDCDGNIDEGVAPLCQNGGVVVNCGCNCPPGYIGYLCEIAVDSDSDGVPDISDCNPLNPLVYQSALLYTDVDGDGYHVNAAVVCYGATLPAGTSLTTLGSGDCDDNNFNVNSGATEICNGIDDNCDGNIDEGVAPLCQNGGVVVNCGCNCPPGYVGFLCEIAVDSDSDGIPNVSDCSPLDPLVYQSALLYTDVDGDGYNSGVSIVCYGATLPPGKSLTTLGAGDCNDNNAAVYPGATEICYDGLDNNCNGTIDEGCTPIITVVQSTQCGTTLNTIDQYIYANLVSGAQGYRFKVTDMTTNQVQTIDKALRVFQLTQLGNYAFNRTYQVEVSVRYNNVWQPFYGLPCTITTPATTTQIQLAQCGTTLSNMTDIIYANNVPFAAGYRFRITNLITSAQQVIDRPVRDVRMSTTSIAEFNTTYSIEVAVKNTNGSYLPYGAACTITTPSFPTSQLQVTQCDVVLTTTNTTIYADSYTGASTYRFRFTTGAFTYVFDRPTRSFVLNSVPVLSSGTTYSVQVALEINGVFGPYGKVCTLTTPSAAREVASKEKEFTAVAYPNPFSDNFKLDVNTLSEDKIGVRVYDMLGKLVEDLSFEVTSITDLQIGSNYPSGIYNIIVTQGNEVKTQRIIKR